jgi:hypothetical protein
MTDNRDRAEMRSLAQDRAELAHLPPGVRHLARWVRLCERQGTRLVDVLADWRDEARRANDIAERHVGALDRLADGAGRLAQHADGYLGDPDGWPDDEGGDHAE